MADTPFGRQPQPVEVIVVGKREDVIFWVRELSRRAEYKGDSIQQMRTDSFKIFPRAVND